MDDDLRDLERAARADPGDLHAGRAYAEALRRAGDRRALFRELTRLARRGDAAAAREARGWVPWSGPGGPGDTHHRACRAVRARPGVGTLELPQESGAWRVLGAGDRWLALAAVTMAGGAVAPIPFSFVRVDTDRLVVTAHRSLTHLMGTTVLLHGEDLVWFEDDLCRASAEDPTDVARRPVPPATHALVDVASGSALLASCDVSSAGSVDLALKALPLPDQAGPAWTRRVDGGPMACVVGHPVINVSIDEHGAPLHPGALGNWERSYRTVLERLDPETGERRESTAPIDARHVQVLGSDERGVLLRLDRQALELRDGLAGPARWSRRVNHQDDGMPPPVLTARDVVLLDAPPPARGLPSYELYVLERSSGRPRWSAPFPLLRSARGRTIGRVTGALAAAEDTLYAAIDDDALTLRAHDLASGAVRWEVQVAVATAELGLGPLTDVRPVQLIVQDEVVLSLVQTPGGTVLVRLRRDA